MKSSTQRANQATAAACAPRKPHPKSGNRQLLPAHPVDCDSITDRHRRIARLIGFGLDDQVIAEACDLQPRAIAEIRSRPEVQAYVSQLEQLARFVLLERKRQFDDLLDRSIGVYREILEDSEASPHTRLKAACEVLDRHPDRHFALGQKSTEPTQHVVDDDAIARLKEIAICTNARRRETCSG